MDSLTRLISRLSRGGRWLMFDVAKLYDLSKIDFRLSAGAQATNVLLMLESDHGSN